MSMDRERAGADQSIDSGEPLIQQTYDWSTTAPSMAILTALGTLEGVDPMELSDIFGAPLYDYIDPEALDRLVSGEGQLNLSFPIDDYRVQIDGAELIISRQ